MFPRLLILVAVLTAAISSTRPAQAENSLPISETWNISSSGKATSSGELLFRVTAEQGSDPVEISVFVLSGSNETGVASSIRRALSRQLDANEFDITEGEGANVRLSKDRGGEGFSVELVDSDVENVRVAVQSVAPVAPPTVPEQSQPANPPVPATPQAPENSVPGNATPPPGPGPAMPSAPPAEPSVPPTQPSAPPATPSAPPATPSAPPGAPSTANGGAGAPASAPPPPPGNF